MWWLVEICYWDVQWRGLLGFGGILSSWFGLGCVLSFNVKGSGDEL